MGRLEDVIKRNQRKGRPREHLVVMAGLGVFLLIIIGLMLFTDLGLQKEPEPGPKQPLRVNGVQLRSPHATPAPTKP